MTVSKQAEMYQKLQEITEALLSQNSETPLTRAIKSLCQQRLDDPLRLIQPAHEERLLLMQTNWNIGLLWVLQKQSKQLRKVGLPFSHPHFEYREPFGAWLNAELTLWDSCFDFADSFDRQNTIKHRTVVDAWFATTLERILADWQQSSCNQQKRHHLGQLNEEIRLLCAGVNPFEEDLLEYRERFNLISFAFAIATPHKEDNNKLRQRRKHFREFTLKPYLDSRSKWAQRLATDAFKKTRLSDGKLELVLGGRQTKTIYPSPTKSFLKQPREKNKSLTIGSA